MMSFSGPRLIKMKAELLILLASVSWSLAQQEQLSQNIVTDEVRTEVIKTKYGRVQGFISRVGRIHELIQDKLILAIKNFIAPQ